MKKIFFLSALLAALFTTSSVFAQPPAGSQGGGDPLQFRQRMIERIKPQLVEKTKLSDAEADKVLDIYMGSMQQRRDIRSDNSLSDDDKKKKMDAINEENTKKYKAIPLSDEKVKAVSDFFEEMRKNMQNRGSQGGGGNH